MEQHPFLKKGGNERRRLETPVPEAEDDFFDNERHLVGVFDFDYVAHLEKKGPHFGACQPAQS